MIRRIGKNVVLHEFAHQLDFEDSAADEYKISAPATTDAPGSKS